MRYGTLIIASAAALALAGCGSKTKTTSVDNTTIVSSETGTTNTAIPASVPLSPGQTFANAAASSDAFEIATSRLAQTASTSAAIKAFAGRMIEAHTGSTEKLKAAGAAASPAITPDPTLTTEQQSALDSLKSKTGADFDAAYKAAQVDGHQKTLDAIKAYAASGTVPQLKTFAAGLVPTVTAHLNMAKGLKA